MLAEPGADWTLPAASLTVGDLFPGEKVTFSFAGLPREPFDLCFPGSR